MAVLGFFAIFSFLLPIPFVFYAIIQKHKPKEVSTSLALSAPGLAYWFCLMAQSLYDAEGKLRQGAKAYTGALVRICHHRTLAVVLTVVPPMLRLSRVGRRRLPAGPREGHLPVQGSLRT